jgi:glutathione S-transferase
MVCAYELGIESRIEKVYALVSLSKTNADVMQVNPIGRIPALVADDGAVLYDSNVICEYLDALHGDSRLFAKESPRRWDALRRLALGDGMLETGVLWRSELSRAPEQQSAAVSAAFEQKSKSAVAAVDRDLPPAARQGIDIGDIAIGCALGYLDFRFPHVDWRASAPRAAAWFESFAARRSIQETQPYEE